MCTYVPVVRIWLEERFGWWTQPDDGAMHAWMLMRLGRARAEGLQAAVAIDAIIAVFDAKRHGSGASPHALMNSRFKELRFVTKSRLCRTSSVRTSTREESRSSKKTRPVGECIACGLGDLRPRVASESPLLSWVFVSSLSSFPRLGPSYSFLLSGKIIMYLCSCGVLSGRGSAGAGRHHGDRHSSPIELQRCFPDNRTARDRDRRGR